MTTVEPNPVVCTQTIRCLECQEILEPGMEVLELGPGLFCSPDCVEEFTGSPL